MEKMKYEELDIVFLSEGAQYDEIDLPELNMIEEDQDDN